MKRINSEILKCDLNNPITNKDMLQVVFLEFLNISNVWLDLRQTECPFLRNFRKKDLCETKYQTQSYTVTRIIGCIVVGQHMCFEFLWFMCWAVRNLFLRTGLILYRGKIFLIIYNVIYIWNLFHLQNKY